MESTYYPVMDIFAGVGGLSEGFSSFQSVDNRRPFRTTLAIEKDPATHSTLLLRSFFKQFAPGEIPSEYWLYVKREITREELFAFYPVQAFRAINIAYCIELGKKNHETVRLLIEKKLGNAEASKKWVLLGSPPCQVYSIAGRSRMKNAQPDFEKDERHFLYQQYLKILADHKPPVFVMENVKGLLSATHSGQRIIEKILRELKHPGSTTEPVQSDVSYRLFSLTQQKHPDLLEPEDFLIKAEKYGIPQTRHRVVILGIRSDIYITPEILTPRLPPNVTEVIGDLPKIRSVLSKEKDSFEHWKQSLKSVRQECWYLNAKTNGLLQTVHKMEEVLDLIDRTDLTPGSEVFPYHGHPAVYDSWFQADSKNFITHHAARKHMQRDLYRYLFAASYAAVHKKSASLCHFPKQLLPANQNIQDGRLKNFFGDRFRVLLGDKPSNTITAHLSKDGHSCINPDSSQCRSLTVREAARLQTFPDNFIFESNRTSQYQQVGNAVPPLLSLQIAEIVYDILQRIKPL